jgi:hypothetical protein
MCYIFVMGWHACRYCLGTVLNTFAYEEEKQMRLQCQSMLAVAKNIFSRLGELQLISSCRLRNFISWTSVLISLHGKYSYTDLPLNQENQR